MQCCYLCPCDPMLKHVLQANPRAPKKPQHPLITSCRADSGLMGWGFGKNGCHFPSCHLHGPEHSPLETRENLYVPYCFFSYRLPADVLKNVSSSAISPLSIGQPSFHENLSIPPDMGNREDNEPSQTLCNGFYVLFV